MLRGQGRFGSCSHTARFALLCTLGVMLSLILHPAETQAQASLAGVVRDSSGAVLPGVTVEASSSVLIEKVRVALTDSTGQYRVAELPPGLYTVTSTLPGFSTVQRQDVEVGGVGVITINAEMRVGALQETITVTGETPIVDVQSSRRGATPRHAHPRRHRFLTSHARIQRARVPRPVRDRWQQPD